jgi:iron-sulfur cluster repair protein YtfE (RIC family)
MDATKLLESQHRQVKSLLEELEDVPIDAMAIARTIANNLAAHMAIEQDIFYPAVSDVAPELVQASYEEHALAEIAVKRLLRTVPNDGAFKARVTALKELVLRHVREEEKELFPRVERAMGGRLDALGTQMAAAFEAALGQGYDALVPPTFARTSSDEAVERLEVHHR